MGGSGVEVSWIGVIVWVAVIGGVVAVGNRVGFEGCSAGTVVHMLNRSEKIIVKRITRMNIFYVIDDMTSKRSGWFGIITTEDR